MPNRITRTSGGADHGNPFVGPVNHTVAIRVDVSGLTATEVDANGYLKPGVILKRDGTIIAAPAAAATAGFGVVVEAVKVADGNTALAGVTDDIDVTVAVVGAVNRAILEDNMGRALNANELVAFEQAASSPIVLLY